MEENGAVVLVVDEDRDADGNGKRCCAPISAIVLGSAIALVLSCGRWPSSGVR
jgi:hypothetical protein